MNPPGARALSEAMALYVSPHRLAQVRSRPLPEDVHRLLQVAGGDPAVGEVAASAFGCTPELVREAAVFYLQQVLLDPAADSWRVLGLASGADAEALQRNRRLLVRWLHPDRNHDPWESVFVDRVNAAWDALRTPERRTAYARGPAPATPAVAAPAPVDPAAAEALGPVARSRARSALLLGGCVTMAIAGLAMQYGLQLDAPEEPEQPRDGLVAANAPGPGPVRAAVARVAAPPARTFGSAFAPMAAAQAHEAVGPAPLVEPVAIPAPPVPKPAPPTHAAAAPRGTLAAAAPAAAPSPATPARQSPAPAPVARSEPVFPVAPPASAATIALAAAAAPAPAPASSAAGRLDDVAARALVQRFAERFERGDAATMRSLFTAEPSHELRGTLRDYERLFAQTEYRRLDLAGISVLPAAGGVTLLGDYTASIVDQGSPQYRVEHGVIRFDVRDEGGEARIYRLRQERRND
jgi:hypothetical protein